VRGIKDAAVNLVTETYFQDRQLLQERFYIAVEEVLAEQGFYYMPLPINFQLRMISLPHDFEQAILNKLLMFQYQNNARFQQQKDVVYEGVNQIRQNAESDALWTLKNDTAVGNGKVEIAQADGSRQVVQHRGVSYGRFVDELSLVADEKLRWNALHFYMWAKLNRLTKASNVEDYIGLEKATLEL